MRNFAQGKGEPPRIVIRSGRMSLVQVNEGRSRIAWFLGRAYQFGHIVTKDLQEAQTWFTVAANKGHVQSQVFLARMLETEFADSDSKEKAYYWFSVAANSGNRLAVVGKDRVGAQLTAELRDKLGQEVNTFRAR